VNWLELCSIEQYSSLLEQGNDFAVFKHSTRCSISSMAKSRLERTWNADPSLPLYLLDVIARRSVSSEIASTSGIKHESPQLLVWREGKVIYHASHNAINAPKAEAIK